MRMASMNAMYARIYLKSIGEAADMCFVIEFFVALIAIELFDITEGAHHKL